MESTAERIRSYLPGLSEAITPRRFRVSPYQAFGGGATEYALTFLLNGETRSVVYRYFDVEGRPIDQKRDFVERVNLAIRYGLTPSA